MSSQDILVFIENALLNDYKKLIYISDEYKCDGEIIKDIIENFAEVNVKNEVIVLETRHNEISAVNLDKVVEGFTIY
ncbi:hypothetical protein [Clostridium lacusfryxellense]|uniref:hypothetical protein n=1 Tax=Clostridium lacusfryxellense TaxID=205328 RepID=UPI001C0B07B8|nr:hypothetical protein [Clostridium lacusfryxellense]MBU3112735.1 hypothetical protein [Clostridium lacusfryxellense]